MTFLQGVSEVVDGGPSHVRSDDAAEPLAPVAYRRRRAMSRP